MEKDTIIEPRISQPQKIIPVPWGQVRQGNAYHSHSGFQSNDASFLLFRRTNRQRHKNHGKQRQQQERLGKIALHK
jgi:hypothetical protein